MAEIVVCATRFSLRCRPPTLTIVAPGFLVVLGLGIFFPVSYVCVSIGGSR
jgi:hypothetical protein